MKLFLKLLFGAIFVWITVMTIPTSLAVSLWDAWSPIATLWTATIHALAAWLALGSLASIVIYALLTPHLRRVSQSLRAGAQ